MGPSTGLPTRTSQGDILSTYYLSHGDTRHIILFPATPAECFEFAGTAFDLAERLQTPVFVLSDLDLGMNYWISDKFSVSRQAIDRGKVLDAEGPRPNLGGKWGRYKDVDGDGIPYRTLPGNKHKLAAYFTRGTGHNEYAIYSERPEDLGTQPRSPDDASSTRRANWRRRPLIEEVEGATVGIISLGSNDAAVARGARPPAPLPASKPAICALRALPIIAECPRLHCQV